MKNSALLCAMAVVVTSCASLSPYSPQVQNNWQGRDIKNMLYRKGNFGAKVKTDKNGERYYIWEDPSKPKKDCQFRVYIDSQNKMTKIVNYSIFSPNFMHRLCKDGDTTYWRQSDEDYIKMIRSAPVLTPCERIWGKDSLMCLSSKK